MTLHRSFGQQLAFYRGKAGLSQETLAEKCGLSRNYISLLESNRREPSFQTVLRIQKALGIDLQCLAPDALLNRVLKEETPLYESKKISSGSDSQIYDRLVRRLRKCNPREIDTISKITNQVLKLLRESRGKSTNS